MASLCFGRSTLPQSSFCLGKGDMIGIFQIKLFETFLPPKTIEK
uniref:Uncharacterized protein n=1 Tax=Rhizophora mucronata TaxID=61149 RepID=A0A2P2PJP4_RHIMU